MKDFSHANQVKAYLSSHGINVKGMKVQRYPEHGHGSRFEVNAPTSSRQQVSEVLAGTNARVIWPS